MKKITFGLISLLATLGLVFATNAGDATKVSARDYDENYDVWLDDLSGDTPAGTLTNGAFNKVPYLTAQASGDFGKDPNEALYKAGIGSFTFSNSKEVTLSMRIGNEGALSLGDLSIAIRGGDSYVPYAVTFDTLFTTDGESMPALTNEFQDYTISWTTSLEGTEMYTVASTGELSTVNVLSSEMVGIHIYYSGEGDMTTPLEISSIKSGSTVVDDFNRTDVSSTVGWSGWWRGSVGTIVNKSIHLNQNDSQYDVYDDSKTDFSGVVVLISGDSTGVSFAVRSNSAYSSYIPYLDIKDYDNNTVESLSNEKQAIYIDAENTFSIVDDITGVSIRAATPNVHIWGIFLSNNESTPADVSWPSLDLKNVTYFDDFNRADRNKFETSYDASQAALTDEDKQHGVDYNIAYEGADYVSLIDEALVFKPNNGSLVNYGHGVKTDVSNNDYLVFSVKTTENATLDGFRVSIGNDILWANQFMSGNQLPAAQIGQVGYPFIDGEFTWLIIDLHQHEISPSNTMVFYYESGVDVTGNIVIDQIFYTNAKDDLNTTSRVGIEETTYSLDAAKDLGTFTSTLIKDTVLVEMDMTITGTTKIDGLSLVVGGTELTFASGLINQFGEVIPTEYSDETFKVTVDLLANGITLVDGASVVLKNNTVVAGGTLTVAATLKDRVLHNVRNIIASTSVDTSGYVYGGGIDLTQLQSNLIEFNVTSTSDVVDGISSLRLEFVTGEFLFLNTGTVYNQYGELISTNLIAGENSIVIDLTASGIDVNSIKGAGHFHAGGWGPAATLTVEINEVSYRNLSQDVTELEQFKKYDIVAPTVSMFEVSGSTTVGSELTVTYNINDDVSLEENLTVKVIVSYGSGITYMEENITSTMKFTPTVAQDYTFTITVTDEAGNEVEVDKVINITEATTEPPITSEPSVGESTTIGSTSTGGGNNEPVDNTMLIVILSSVGGVILLGGVIFFVINKRSKK